MHLQKQSSHDEDSLLNSGILFYYGYDKIMGFFLYDNVLVCVQYSRVLYTAAAS